MPRHACDGTAILTAQAPALDIDVDREVLALQLRDAAWKQLGITAERIGRAPRRALVYRLEGDAFRKLALSWEGGAIEFMGAGQALTVSGRHATTGRPYVWIGPPIWTTPREELPGVDRHKAVRFMRGVGRWLAARGVEHLAAHGFSLDRRPLRSSACPTRQPSNRYLTAALERAIISIQGAPEGRRSDALNAEAFGVGRFVAEGLLDPQEVETRLLAATTLPPREARATIRSAFRARGVRHA